MSSFVIRNCSDSVSRFDALMVLEMNTQRVSEDIPLKVSDATGNNYVLTKKGNEVTIEYIGE